MQVVPLTLHRQVKFIYMNTTYPLFAAKPHKPLKYGSSCSTTSHSSSNPSTSSNTSISFKDVAPSSTPDSSTQLESPPKDIFSPKGVHSDDDWGSLDFTPTFIGEYRVSWKESKTEKEKSKGEPKEKPIFLKQLSNNFVAASNSNNSFQILPLIHIALRLMRCNHLFLIWHPFMVLVFTF